jgi:hypothetical protein
MRNAKSCEYAPGSGRANERQPISSSSEPEPKPVKGTSISRLMQEMTAALSLGAPFEIESMKV